MPDDVRKSAVISDARLELALRHVARTGRCLDFRGTSYHLAITPAIARYMLGQTSAAEFLREAT